MGASGWGYFVAYQPDLDAALDALREEMFTEGRYWWAHGPIPNSARDCDDRPTTMEELFGDELAQETGTHSILDVHRVLSEGEQPAFGTVQPVTATEALRHAGTERLTREHVDAIDSLAERSWLGRCAVLHDTQGQPEEIYFWGFSGD
ncbi:hypothetical protein V6V47_08050 [Micromonospora sp. CPCC 205539]|uniref:hypothetical protein n=1 Tax=Micromonospora sp. CPCC 205539 TaxID=3122408 RepID=UPI002FF1041C